MGFSSSLGYVGPFNGTQTLDYYAFFVSVA
jgi:hypothetical protein